MTAITTSADGANIFLALEDVTGLPVIATAARTDLTTWSATYEPGEGDAANVKQIPGNGDRVIFYGNFGSKEITTAAGTEYSPRIIVQHTISTDVILDISPGDVVFGSPTEKTSNALASNPSDPDEVWATINGDLDLRRTFGVRAVIQTGGPEENVWETLDPAFIQFFGATVLAVIFNGAYSLDGGFIGGAGKPIGPNPSYLTYSANEFAGRTQLDDATLRLADNISGIEIGEQ